MTEVHMPAPNRQIRDVLNRELERECAYDTKALEQQVQRNVPLLNKQQRTAYDRLM